MNELKKQSVASCAQRWSPFSKSRKSYKYKANRHLISVASMAQSEWEITRSRGPVARVRGAMAPVASYGILLKRLKKS